MCTFLSSGSKDSYASLNRLPLLAIPVRLILRKTDTLFSGLVVLERGGDGAVKSVQGLSTSSLRNDKVTLLVRGFGLPLIKGWHSQLCLLSWCYITLFLSSEVSSPVASKISTKGLGVCLFFSFYNSVLVGWDPGVWFAFCLHLCLLQESTSSQNLAAIGEEGSLGCVLQR